MNEYEAGYIHRPKASGIVDVKRIVDIVKRNARFTVSTDGASTDNTVALAVDDRDKHLFTDPAIGDTYAKAVDYAARREEAWYKYVNLDNIPTETLVTDPETGGQKGQKAEQYSLIPVEALAVVAKVYGYGAEKYTSYGECTCASAGVSSTPEECAGRATTETSNSGIPPMPNGSVATVQSGSGTIESEWQSTAEITEDAELPAKRWQRFTGFQQNNTTPSLPPLAASAERPASISTTTTSAANEGARSASVVASATAAISGSGISKAGTRSTAKQHAPGCGALKVITEGRNNWRLGYKWHLSYDALQRHLTAFWRGENDDPESGLPHLAHAIFHCMTLLTYMQDEKYKTKDDRA